MIQVLPWERLLWSGRPACWLPRHERYVLTDLRLVRVTRTEADEILLHDIREIDRIKTGLDRVLGTSTLKVYARQSRRGPLVLARIRRGPQLAALLEWLAGEPIGPRSALDARAVHAALAWDPKGWSRGYAKPLAGLTVMIVSVTGIGMGLHGKTDPGPWYASDDPISPGGTKRSEAKIAQYMEDEVMPWARAVLGPLKGGPDRISCATCHGLASREWRMPAVAELPQPDLKEQGWEQYGGPMDAQMRNAIYGYLAESDKQTRAAYMRDVVMPGMARLLRRPAYDFTRSYEYNRSRRAFGCYHCHRVR